MTITNLVVALMVVSSCGDCNSVKTNLTHVNVISNRGMIMRCNFPDCWMPTEIPLSDIIKCRVASIYFEVPKWYCENHKYTEYINRYLKR